jgi:hypothetical protein
MILLVEQAAPAEVTKEGKKCYISSLMLSNQPNRNGRVYHQDVLDEAVDNVHDKLRSNSLYGELGHSDKMSIDPNRIAVMVRSLRKHPNGYYGKSEVLDTNAGKTLKSILDVGGRMGVSSRGSGEAKKDREGLLEVSKFNLVSLDVVAEPSTGELFQHVYEAVLQEEIAAQDSRKGNRLSDEALRSKTAEITQHLVALLRDAHPDDLAANKRALDYDGAVNPYLNPLSDKTFLDVMQTDRAKIVAALLNVAKDIASQNDMGSSRDKLSAYADLIANTSDPLRKSSLRREAARQVYGSRLIEAACKLMSRSSNLQTSPDNSLVEHLRRNAGSKLRSTERELDEVLQYHKRSRSK